MKKILLSIPLLLLLGCQDKAEKIDLKIVSEEEVLVEEVIKYSTIEAYIESIVFMSDKKLKTDPYKDIYLKTEKGIKRFNIGNFYDEYKTSEIDLEAQREYFATVELMHSLIPKIEPDPIYDFIQEKNNREGPIIDTDGEAKANKNLLKQLSEKKNKTIKDYQKLILLSEENGDYSNVQSFYEIQCKKDPSSCKKIEFKVSGWMKDHGLNEIPFGAIQVLNDPASEPFKADESGNYSFTITTRPNQLIRLRYLAPGYMPLIKEVRLGPAGPKYDSVFEVRLPKAFETQELSTKTNKKIETKWNTTYDMENAELRDSSGKIYKGAYQAHLYDYNPWGDDMSDFLNGSIRVRGGVVPEIALQSYGMAYVSFLDEEGNLLQVPKKNPITVTSEIAFQKGFYEEYRLDGETKEDFWKYWIEYSDKTGGFIGNDSEREFTSYWVYNIQSGIWEEVKLKIIAPGMIQSIFYTHN